MAPAIPSTSTVNAQNGASPLGELPALDSFSTALVLLPPPSIQTRVNALRSANDKSHPRWTAHVTLIFPFVRPELLSSTLASLRTAIKSIKLKPFPICLNTVGRFRQREYETIYLGQTQAGDVLRLWEVLAETLGYQGRAFVPHLTLGQTSHRNEDIQLLQTKGQRMLQNGALEWMADGIAVLRKDESDGGKMRIVDEILFNDTPMEDRSIVSDTPFSYHYIASQGIWLPMLAIPAPHIACKDLSVVTFNILHSAQHLSLSRFDGIRSTLVDLDSDIVCLQEVTDDFLSVLLQDDLVRSRWTWCTRGADTPMESERNIVVLTKDHLPFSWKRVVLGEKHKAASILTLRLQQPNPAKNPITLVLSVVHLTAGLTARHLDTKSKEFLTLIQYLELNHPGDEWVIAGDTNFPSNYAPFTTAELVVTDVWEAYHSHNISNVNGYTFDPLGNPLAAQTMRKEGSPHRYDRIYVKRPGPWALQVQSVAVYDGPEVCESPASDHWALYAKLRLLVCSPPTYPISHPKSSHSLAEAPPASSLTSAHDQEDPAPDSELRTFAQAAGAIPNSEQDLKRNLAIHALSRVIGASCRWEAQKGLAKKTPPPGTSSTLPATAVQLVLVLVGSVSMGLEFPDSDLDCIVVGNVSAPTFWAMAKQRIAMQKPSAEYASDGHVVLRRFVRDAAVQMMVLEVGGIKVDLQYCLATNVAENWEILSSTSSGQIYLPAPSMRVLNAHRDQLRLRKCIASLPAFQLAYRSVKIFCFRHGIYAARFGYLGGMHLLILLCRLAQSAPGNATAFDFVREFFAIYSSFDWENSIASIADVDTTYRRTNREPMVILSPERPVRNVGVNASASTQRVINREFRIAHELLIKGTRWSQICGHEKSGLSSFLDEFDNFVKIDVGYWGGNCMHARALIGFIESRIIHLLVDLHVADRDAYIRLWPERLVDSYSACSKKGSSVLGFYLVGLRCQPGLNETKALNGVFRIFENTVRRNPAYFDASDSFFSVSECGRASLGSAIFVDKLSWGDDGIDDPQSSDDENYTQLEEADDDQDPRCCFSHISTASTKKQQKTKSKATSHVPAGKLRTSADVFNRLMWDPQLDQNDYLIGYEDRFAGVKEMPLSSWKRDVEDEAFIPFHRVVHFRQKFSKEIVWDRRTKIDHVFGSGVLAKS